MRVDGDGPGGAGGAADPRDRKRRRVRDRLDAHRPAARPTPRRTRSPSLRAINQTTSGIATRAPTLDDVYLRLTGDRLPEAA